ncbi:MAG: hypothetical protein RBT75_06480 [Anaerolineae bacterium]|nr:hypothetical protein [Anaerolineae bacterium]
MCSADGFSLGAPHAPGFCAPRTLPHQTLLSPVYRALPRSPAASAPGAAC